METHKLVGPNRLFLLSVYFHSPPFLSLHKYKCATAAHSSCTLDKMKALALNNDNSHPFIKFKFNLYDDINQCKHQTVEDTMAFGFWIKLMVCLYQEQLLFFNEGEHHLLRARWSLSHFRLCVCVQGLINTILPLREPVFICLYLCYTITKFFRSENSCKAGAA